MSYNRSLLVLSLILLFTITARVQVAAQSKINDLADLYIKKMFEFFPEQGTINGIKGIDNAALSDNSISGNKVWETFQDSLFKVLKVLDKKGLNKTDWVTYEILQEQLEANNECQVCKFYLWPINHLSGWQVYFNNLANAQPVGSDLGRKHTLERWRLIPGYIQNEIENLKAGIKTNYTAPKQNVRLVISQIDQILNQTTEQSFFYNPAVRDTNALFRQALKDMIEQQIYPAARMYKEFLANTYLQAAREDMSIAALPDGLICYKAILRKRTTLRISPDDVYNAGIEAIQKREEISRRIGNEVYGSDNLEQIKIAIQTDTLNKFSTKEDIIRFSEDAVTRAKLKSLQYFNLMPVAPVEIKPVPEYQGGIPPGYWPAPDDNSRPGTYYIQLNGFQDQIKGAVELTAFHETYPGHHLQTGIARELTKTHSISKYLLNPGFSEGWARYTEILSDEMGLYSSDRNRLVAYANLPVGMIVDPGIHLKGWTRDEAIRYVLEKQARMTRPVAEDYVDRIAVMPGRVTTYGVGEALFWKLRHKAESELGDKFDIKAFHDKCLEQGLLPLNALEQLIIQWIKEEKERQGTTP